MPTDTASPSPTVPIAPPSPLSKDTDRPARPGFRSPSNQNSKAQKGSKKK